MAQRGRSAREIQENIEASRSRLARRQRLWYKSWRLILRFTLCTLILLLLLSVAVTLLASVVHVRRGVNIDDLPRVLAVDFQVLRACPNRPSDIWHFLNRTSSFEQTGAAAADAVCVEK